MDEFATSIARRAAETKSFTLTLLCDRLVPVGDVMHIMAIARSKGFAHVQIAEKRDI